jgi:hypothetical protein
MASRIILRIELSSDAKRKFENTPVTLGMTQFAVTNKLFQWFLDQNEEVQASILGFYPRGVAQNTTTAILKRIISGGIKPDRRRD